jgi:alkane 1-monooxygenase
MKAIRFAGPFGFLLSIPLLYAISPAATLATPLSFLLALLVLEQIGRKRERAGASSPAIRMLPIGYIPLQLAVILWAAWVTTHSGTSLEGLACLAVSVGVCAGVFGMLAAHELVHSRSRWERRLGLLMLFGMSYPHFRIAHVHGHHRHAVTERDAATARSGESLYKFLFRTIPAQLVEAWRFERRRNQQRRMALFRNRIVRGGALLATVYAFVTLVSPRAAIFLAAQSVIAIILLELFNYIAHYGLVRRMRAGTLERLAPNHSWNSSGLGNLLIFNMGHHSDHHDAPDSAFDRLGHAAGARELPAGYAGAIVLALVPPLWRAVMDHRIAPAPAGKFAYNVDSSPAALTP